MKNLNNMTSAEIKARLKRGEEFSLIWETVNKVMIYKSNGAKLYKYHEIDGSGYIDALQSGLNNAVIIVDKITSKYIYTSQQDAFGDNQNIKLDIKRIVFKNDIEDYNRRAEEQKAEKRKRTLKDLEEIEKALLID